MKRYKVLFCDLDGTLTDTISGNTFPKGVWDMALRLPVFDAIKRLAPEYVFIVSNQGGIEKGYVNANSFVKKLDYICISIAEYCLINKDKVSYAYCKSNDKEDKYRKPNTGMLELFYHVYIENYDSDKKDALMIGDASGKKGQFSDSDLMTARNFGIDYLDVIDFIAKSYDVEQPTNDAVMGTTC